MCFFPSKLILRLSPTFNLFLLNCLPLPLSTPPGSDLQNFPCLRSSPSRVSTFHFGGLFKLHGSREYQWEYHDCHCSRRESLQASKDAVCFLAAWQLVNYRDQTKPPEAHRYLLQHQIYTDMDCMSLWLTSPVGLLIGRWWMQRLKLSTRLSVWSHSKDVILPMSFKAQHVEILTQIWAYSFLWSPVKEVELYKAPN